MVSDLMIAYKQFVDQLTEEQKDRTILILKTTPIDGNGTDLIAIHKHIMPNYNISIVPDGLQTNPSAELGAIVTSAILYK